MRKNEGTSRVPDVEPEMWFGTGVLRNDWRKNWKATGDHQREPSEGPAPPGWSSYQLPPRAAPVVPPTKRKPTMVSAGRFATWTRVDYGARCLQTTIDPTTFADGGRDLGPKWSKVVRRTTYDLQNGSVLEDINPKGRTYKSVTGKIPGSKPNRGRDIRTVFHFRATGAERLGKKIVDNVAAPAIDEVANDLPPAPAKCSESMFSQHVLRTQQAMGCPLRGQAIIGHMPLLPPEEAQQMTAEHRERFPNELPLLLNAAVARPVGRKERDGCQAALDAVAKEWKRLRSIKHRDGVGVWDESQVREKRRVAEEANRSGVIVHFARIFDLCVEKGSELPPGHKDRKFNGRAVLQGAQVRDQNWEAA